MFGRPGDWFSRWPDRVQSVSLEAARTAAKKNCGKDKFVVVVAGDREKVEPELAGLGLPVFRYDAQGGRLGD